MVSLLSFILWQALAEDLEEQLDKREEQLLKDLCEQIETMTEVNAKICEKLKP